MASTPKEKKPLAVPKGRQWTQLTYKAFNRTFPRLGIKRLSKREDPEGQRQLAELKEYVWRYRRKRKYRYPGRYSPSKRQGARFCTVMVPMDVYLKLKELSKFHKLSMARILREYVETLFDETYKEAELLARIANRTTKDEA